MTELDVQNKACPEEEELNFLDYWAVINKRKQLISRIIVATVLTVAVISLLMKNIYQAKAVITPITSRESGASAGTMSSLALQFGALPGIVLPGGSSAAEIVNLLKSNILREKVLERYQLLPVLFHDRWDAEKKDWKHEISLNPLVYVGKLVNAVTGSDGKAAGRRNDYAPDVWDGLRTLDRIVKVNHNLRENIITVTADYYDPETASKIVEYMLTTVTDHMSSEAKRVATINRKYLEEQLGTTADPLIRQKIYNLIAQQVEMSMMAEVKENFAFKILDPPMVPDKKIKPQRTIMVLLGFAASIVIAVFIAFFMEYLEKAKSKEKERVET